jgi:hypothetical protein
VHDQLNLDELGIPGVFIASSEFVSAADVQSKSLGIEPDVVYVQHPIQDRTDDEMRALAEGAVEEIVGKLLGGGG